MGALADLWSSERGLVAVALIIAATVLTALRVLPTEQWVTYTEWIFVAYAASKTVTGSVAIMKSGVSSGTPSENSSATAPSPTLSIAQGKTP